MPYTAFLALAESHVNDEGYTIDYRVNSLHLWIRNLEPMLRANLAPEAEYYALAKLHGMKSKLLENRDALR